VRVHTYVIATDAGSAPNYDRPFVTLAVCKPRIRRKAEIGELMLGFAGKQVNPTEPHSVVWAGIVTEKMSFAEYWNYRRFAGKKPARSEHPDNFYRPVDGGLFWVPNDVHGPEATNHDTGGKFVLGFTPWWRFSWPECEFGGARRSDDSGVVLAQ
jgi:Nucleotide modification associated domain 2